MPREEKLVTTETQNRDRTNTVQAQPAYRVMALEDAPIGHPGQGIRSVYTLALAALAPKTVAEFSPCGARHFALKAKYGGVGCLAAIAVRSFAKRHGIKVTISHKNGALYIARLS